MSELVFLLQEKAKKIVPNKKGRRNAVFTNSYFPTSILLLIFLIILVIYMQKSKYLVVNHDYVTTAFVVSFFLF